MAISRLLKDITPDYQETFTPEQAEKELANFTFLGAGWYITELGSMLVVATDTENQFVFSIFYGRDVRLYYQAIAIAHVHTPELKTAVSNRPSALTYWGGITILWALTILVGLKWGFKAEIPVLFALIVYPYLLNWFSNKGKKNDAR